LSAGHPRGGRVSQARLLPHAASTTTTTCGTSATEVSSGWNGR